MKLNVVITGVGGQGLITLANVIANAALREGVNSIVAETHGLSQRGGTVIVHVRLGDVEAPLIPKGEGDLMLSMELLEAARYLDFLSKDAEIVVNDYLLPPPLPGIEVPSRNFILNVLNRWKVFTVPATSKALQLGDPRSANMVLLGKALKHTKLGEFISLNSVLETVRELWPKAYEINKRAIEVGMA
ncbi:indolepyruvate oxidoreductase subunit beta [Ignicoccus islandicus]|uniref:indolepyruvate oxidoreductase subunit beta n=1 Tax=Ignicoccus islandicus TaxID=54259 RepID=UPI0009464C55|nr:indolepyruvate oxidoreductase subunit beta [Ignicoccus islandicus]